LARLAPRFFDSAVVDREARHRAEQRCWMAQWESALAKVYGCEPHTNAHEPDAELPPLPSARTQRAVERELAGWGFWMDAGRAAMTRQHQHRAQALISLNQVARLLRVASDLKILACGDSAPDYPSESSDYRRAWADLERAYGNKCKSPSALPLPVPPGPAVAPPGVAPMSNVGGSALNQPPPSTSVATPPAERWWRPDAKHDLVPHALVRGPHGLLCLQRIDFPPLHP